MNHPWKFGLAAVALAAVLLLVGSFHTVTEGEAVVVVRLGRPARVIRSAGPAWKFPEPIERLHRIDLRRQLADTPPATALTRDRKSVVIESFVAWRVDDPLLFVQSTTGLDSAAETIVGMVSAAQNQELSRFALADLVATEPASAANQERFEERVRERVSPLLRARLGVVVDRVGVRRVSLPVENIPAVLERMRADRETEAARLRAEGAQAAQAIRDEAHVRSQTILREGREEASRVTAESEREAAQRLAATSELDPEFFRLWMSLQASKAALGKQARIVLNGDRLFFRSLWPSSGEVDPAPERDATPRETRLSREETP